MCSCNKCKQQESALIPELESLLQEGEYGMTGEYEYENDYETEYEDEYEFEGTPTVTPPVPTGTIVAPKSKQVWLRNTDLNAPCFLGNFNFLYNSGANEATITLNTKLAYQSRFSDKDKRDFWRNYQVAADYWNRSAEVQLLDRNSNVIHRVALNFKVKPVTNSRDMNKETEVYRPGVRASWGAGKGQAAVSHDINVYIDSNAETLAHELGHVWGLKDEYPYPGWVGKVFMKLSPCHVGRNSAFSKDSKSVMHYAGVTPDGEFRTRHYVHFGRAILNAFWSDPRFISPIVQNGKVVARRIMGRIALLKRSYTNPTPYTTDMPDNPRFTNIQVAKR